MGRKIYGIFMAGGRGLRMGGSVPKQFLELSGVPVLQLTIGRFIEACQDIEVVTVLPEDCFSAWDSLCGKHGFEYRQTLVAGGITRFHSVKNALEKIPDGVTVMIHDGVRPFVSVDLIRRMAGLSGRCRGLIPVLPVTDSLKSLEKDANGELHTSSTPDPDRGAVYAAQTPQVFCSEDIKEAYRQPFDLSFTDDASVARKYGIPLSYVLGERNNIKLTTPEDIILARAFQSLS